MQILLNEANTEIQVLRSQGNCIILCCTISSHYQVKEYRVINSKNNIVIAIIGIITSNEFQVLQTEITDLNRVMMLSRRLRVRGLGSGEGRLDPKGCWEAIQIIHHHLATQ
jgi:hypothetical protein